MEINWSELIQSIGISGLIVAGISWTIKKLGDHYLERKFVVFENKIETKSKEYQLQLDIVFAKSTKLHEKRLTILEDIYRKITTLNMKMNEMTAFMKPVVQDADKEENDRIENAAKSYNDFLQCYVDYKIFFSKDTCILLDSLREKYFDSYWDYTMTHRIGSKDFKFNYEHAQKASETVRTQIPPVLENLEVEFRKLLGVN